MLDAAIIGAGPIGLACAIEAQKRGKRAVIFEKGCLANSLYHYPTNMTFFSTPDLVEIGGLPFICRDMKPTRSEALEYYRRVKEFFQLDVRLYEAVQRIEGSDGVFDVQTAKGRYAAKKIIAAVGFFDRPRMMNVPGEDLEKVIHYYREPHPFAGQKILVAGSGNSAVIAALECHRRGAEVTCAVRSSSFHDGVKYWLLPDILNRIQCGEIQAYFNARVAEIKPKSVCLIDREDRRFEIDNDFVLAMTGYEPNFDFLESIGVQIGKDECRTPAHDPQTYETNRPGIYLAGVVVGGLRTNKWFIENSRDHAAAVFNHIESSS
ncbi:MAG: YpdA family putative bacillithiol disulfide reductase [Candidatus Omnitrophica bacterium]|nr:YpdA family putative bacillithiol disulfide reductase [Candidatus Omnitrophota bacterium]